MRELSLNVMDIVQNSIAAEASLISIAVKGQTQPGLMTITIGDNGRGMSPQQVQQVQCPFYTTRTTRPVGLGVPLFKMASEMTGGAFTITSREGEGTVVTAVFQTGHIDMTPLGDMNETVTLLITCNPHIDFLYTKTVDEKSFALDTRELREILGEDVPLSAPDVVAWIRDYLREQEALLDS